MTAWIIGVLLVASIALSVIGLVAGRRPDADWRASSGAALLGLVILAVVDAILVSIGFVAVFF